MNSKAIIVDWGTTAFKAWLVELSSGEILASTSNNMGMSQLDSIQFSEALDQSIGCWKETQPELTVYMAGMVGAAGGWCLAPQLPTPLSRHDLSKNLMQVPNQKNTWIIPGARVPGNNPDIMRGEEVQIFGGLKLSGKEQALMCLPGTHSKWAQIKDHQLVNFVTSMTGEVHQVMLQHSVLGKSLVLDHQTASSEAFEAGLAEADCETNVLHTMFSARTKLLGGSLDEHQVSDYLSGILIGAEVRSMEKRFPPESKPLVLISGIALKAPYTKALERAGYRVEWIDAGTASCEGIREIINITRTY